MLPIKILKRKLVLYLKQRKKSKQNWEYKEWYDYRHGECILYKIRKYNAQICNKFENKWIL